MEKLNNLGAVCTAGSLRTALPALREPRRRPRSVPPRPWGQRRSLRGLGLITATIPGVGVGGDGASPECHLIPASASAWPWWDAGIVRQSLDGVWEVPVRGTLALRYGKIFGNTVKINLGAGGMGQCHGVWDDQTLWTKTGWAQVSRCIRLHPLPAPCAAFASRAGSRDQPPGHWDQHTAQIPPRGRVRLLPGAAVLIPRDDAGLGRLGSDSGCPRRRRNSWKTGLNVPGVKSIASHGHARHQPSNRINAERSRWKGSVGACALGTLPCHPPARGDALSPFSEGGDTLQGWGSRGGGDTGC